MITLGGRSSSKATKSLECPFLPSQSSQTFFKAAARKEGPDTCRQVHWRVVCTVCLWLLLLLMWHFSERIMNHFELSVSYKTSLLLNVLSVIPFLCLVGLTQPLGRWYFNYEQMATLLPLLHYYLFLWLLDTFVLYSLLLSPWRSDVLEWLFSFPVMQSMGYYATTTATYSQKFGQLCSPKVTTPFAAKIWKTK